MRNFDLISTIPNINFKKKTNIQNIEGAILTLILTAILIVSLIFFGKDLVNKQKPNIVHSSNKAFDSVLDPSYNVFAISLSNGLSEIEDFEKYFHWTALYTEYTNSKITKEASIQLVLCSESKYFLSNSYQIKEKILYSNLKYYCLPNEFPLRIHNSDSQNASSSLSFQLK